MPPLVQLYTCGENPIILATMPLLPITMTITNKITQRPNKGRHKKMFFAPKASAEGACILAEMGYCYEEWLVTVLLVCVVTVLLLMV